MWYTTAERKESVVMYEQEKPSRANRIVWAIVYICIAAGVTWLVLWLIFWRNPSTSTNETVKKDTQKTTQTSKTPTTGQTSSASTSTGNTATLGSVAEETGQATTTNVTSTTTSSSSVTTPSTTTTPVAASTTTATPTQLVSTGPESVIIPVTMAVAGGTIFYNLRTRRQLEAQNT